MRLPAVFVSHGSPRLVLNGGGWARALRSLGLRIGNLQPDLVLVVSAHWITRGTAVECSREMKTLHDFHGFSPELYRLSYPARGDPELCREIADWIGAVCVENRGLDHGAWAVLWHMFPDRRFPVSQISIDADKELKDHLALAEKLRSFRDRVVLIG
ncbi:MAG: class III extradiol ring-cleavage dioxygenase, partial [Aquificota bacterium]|nr:class III extradiol ring-cleavage dioxygenase [Aquificota bacterium]